jgi:uncharacterized protein (DUF1501 family)
MAGVNASAVPDSSAADVSAFVNRSLVQSFDAARRFAESSRSDTAAGKFPATKLGEKLRLIARLIKLGGGTRIYYAIQPGYDTHAAQQYTHLRLLNELAEALAALLDDLKAARLDERVMVLAFSEFGRRVQENGSAGTDHGAAGPVLLAGPKVRGGIVGGHPSLAELDDGDLKMAVDFRQVYWTLLSDWLDVDARLVLGDDFEPLSLVA